MSVAPDSIAGGGLAERYARDVYLPRSGGMPDEMRRAFGDRLPPQILREHIPASWFHPVGIRKVLRRLEPLLPDVQGKLFLTFTLERETCGGDPAAAFERARAKLRKVFYKLRNGAEWDGRNYTIDAPYCVKVEFHEDGWAHFHVIFLTRRFLPGELLNELWGLGRCNVQRISNKDFRYLLKYVCKGCDLPEWIKERSRLRVFQSSHGFLVSKPEVATKEPHDGAVTTSPALARKRRELGNIGTRLERWERSALLVTGPEDAPVKRYNVVVLCDNFREMLGRMALHLALENRYLGDGRVLITSREDMLEWMVA